MKTLTEAWDWYENTRRSLQQMRRIGNRYWQEIPWDGAKIGRDDDFQTIEASDIVAATSHGLAPLEDLSVVVMFSVFESQVREHLLALVKPEAESLADPILKEAADDAIKGIEEGSFYKRVLEPLKKQERISADLVTRIDQVRDYRNWVAHGRRGKATNQVVPKDAFSRLREFLEALGIAAEPEELQPGSERTEGAT